MEKTRTGHIYSRESKRCTPIEKKDLITREIFSSFVRARRATVSQNLMAYGTAVMNGIKTINGLTFG